MIAVMGFLWRRVLPLWGVFCAFSLGVYALDDGLAEDLADIALSPFEVHLDLGHVVINEIHAEADSPDGTNRAQIVWYMADNAPRQRYVWSDVIEPSGQVLQLEIFPVGRSSSNPRAWIYFDGPGTVPPTSLLWKSNDALVMQVCGASVSMFGGGFLVIGGGDVETRRIITIDIEHVEDCDRPYMHRWEMGQENT